MGSGVASNLLGSGSRRVPDASSSQRERRKVEFSDILSHVVVMAM